MEKFAHSLIEIHSNYAWDAEKTLRAMDFAQANGMTGVAFHRNDFVDQLLFPSRYISPSRKEKHTNISEIYDEVFRTMYKYDPTRRDVPYKKGLYFRYILREAQKRGLEVYIENKEINYLDCIDELYPQLRNNGAVCATNPFLLEYVKFKYEEFFRLYPGVAGIITSTATGESKTSITANRCTCDRCRNYSAQKWHTDVIMAMYEPIKAAGAKLIVRDFVFNSAAHADISSAMEKLPGDITYSLKNTPHDYYPTFPDNPRIGESKGHNQWIEYDTMGQYYGLGVGIAIMTNDIRHRIRNAKEKNVTGILVRTDWEAIDGHAVFETPNLINLFAVAAIDKDIDADETEIFRSWMKYKGFFAPGISRKEEESAIASLQRVLSRAWDVLSHTAFVNECVFNDSSEFPCSLSHGLWLAEEKNSLKDWKKEKANALSVTDLSILKGNLKEKDDALSLMKELHGQLSGMTSGVNEKGQAFVRSFVDADLLYTTTYRHIVYGILLTKFFREPARDKSFDCKAVEMLKEALSGLREDRAKLEELFRTTDYYYIIYIVLDPERISCLIADLENLIRETSVAKEVLGC